MPGVDSLRFDDLYNNLRVFENDVKGSTASSSSTQNVAFVSENTSSTNDVSTAYGVSNPSGQNSQYEHASSYSLLANQSSCPQLDHEDLEQLDEFDLEEMDLKWQVAMISMRMKKFYKKTGRKLQFDAKEPVGFDKTKVECYNCHKTGHFARECRTKGNQDSKRRDAWNSGNKDGRRSGKQEDSKALVTIDGEGVDWTSHSEEEEDYALMACNSSGSDTEVQSCSNECVASYNKLKKLYDEQRAQLSDASIEIKAYTQALKKVEAQLVAHQQGQLWYEEKIRFMKIDLDDKTDVLTYHKKLLAEAEKEKEDLKAKVEKWHNSSKNLSLLQNSQMSANDKFGLGYGDHRYDGILSYKNEVLQSVFMNKESDLENQPLYDRFVTAEGMHAVPPPMTGNYMPSGPDIEIDYSQFTYGPKQSQASESETQTNDFNSCESNCSEETHESLYEPSINEPRVVSQPKVWSDSLIIEEYESDSEDEHVSLPTEEQETPSFANKQVKSHRETVKNQFTHSKNPKVDKKAVQTRTGKFAVNTARASGTNTVNTARHNVNRQAVPTNAVNIVNTVKPIVNNARPKNVFHKSVSPFKNSFNITTALGTNFSKQKVNTAEVNAVSAVGGKRETADYPHIALKNKGVVDSRCSRHITGNKAYLAKYQDFNGGPVAFGGSKGYITGKEFKNRDFIELCGSKGIKREYSNAKTSQQNGVAERKNRTLIEAARTMLADLFLPNTFWAEAVSTACYVLNTVLVTKPQNKTPYELVTGDSAIEAESAHDYFVLPIWSSYTSTIKSSKANNASEGPTKHPYLKSVNKEDQAGAAKASSTNIVNTASTPVSTASPYGGLSFTDLTNTDQDDSEIPALEEIYDNPTDCIFTTSSYDDEGVVADFTNLEPVVNSDNAGANLDRKSQQEAEYAAAANCCGQVLWIQNQMLDYGFNFMNKKIYIDNESTICIVKNPVFHSKTKHIAIRHHFIRDAYKKKLIQVLKIHIDDNVDDLITKAFDVSKFQFLVVTIRMINP
ncbi:ribonuclease H-like domain-containing protein [Tanacetum coccineum]